MEREQLQSFARSRTLPSALAARATVMLWSVDENRHGRIAEWIGWTKVPVRKCWRRFSGLVWPVCTTKFVLAGRTAPISTAMESELETTPPRPTSAASGTRVEQ